MPSRLLELTAAGRPVAIARTWQAQAVAVSLLAFVAIAELLGGPRRIIDVPLAVAIAMFGTWAVLNARASGTLAERRRSESEIFSRILRALSRSVSPDAIVEAIVHELGAATAADHVAVVRLRPGTEFLDVTFVSTLPGAPTSNTTIAVAELEPDDGPDDDLDPDRPATAASRTARLDPRRRPRPEAQEREAVLSAQAIAERIAARLRLAYGLRTTLASPLETDDAVVGAIVISRRTDEGWPDGVAQLLERAAIETSASLARVYSFQAAEIEARTDQLTQLPNRRYFDEYCTLVSSRRRATDRVAIVAIDVDHFKSLNDEHGHAAGDQVLRAIGNAIQASVRDEDVPARYGGEEFVVLVRNPAEGIPLDVGERIRQAVRSLDLGDLGVGRVTVSVGVATGVSSTEPIPAIVERADRALYTAKRGGRDRVVESRVPVFA